MSFAISEFSDAFVKLINQEDLSFKSQLILEKLSSIDKGFRDNITHDSNNKVASIIWMTSNMRDNFKRFGNYLPIDVIRSSIYNTKEFCYITLVILNKIGWINVVCQGLVITETHDVYTFILESLFQMSISRNNTKIHT